MKDEMENYRGSLAQGVKAGAPYTLMVPDNAFPGKQGRFLKQAAGTSIEFRDYREYQMGDDVRYIDWGIYGRTDRLIVKRFREEVDPHVDLLLDASRSMILEGSDKERTALFLAGFLGRAALNSGCSFRAWMAKDGCYPVENGNDLPSAWENIRFDGVTPLPEALILRPPSWPRRGIRIVVSDLLFPGDPLHMLPLLTESAAFLIIFRITADLDMDPPVNGSLRLIDVETGRERTLFFDEPAKARYRETMAEHTAQWHIAAAKTGTKFLTLPVKNGIGDEAVREMMENDILSVR